jgi:uncharacterized heparinase superfamily protein
MTPEELSSRLRDRCRQELWELQRRVPAVAPSPAVKGEPTFTGVLASPLLADLSEVQRVELLKAADELLEGHWEVLGVRRHDLRDPDWSLDPVSGRRYPMDRSSFRVDYRSLDDHRVVKQVWELSRHQHLTVLAAAWALTKEEAYAQGVARQLRSWWRANPIASGINWASGIELGMRLISWVWIRRLLDDWAEVGELFEHNEELVRQVYGHQRYLATFISRGSSANNHVIAEAAGQLVASCGFPWFETSDRWRRDALRLFEDELAHNTFASGLNRELAFEYHGFVAEVGVVAAAEAAAAGLSVHAETWHLLCQMFDAVAATLDSKGRPPRQGDADEGRALLLTSPASDRWKSLLASGEAIFGALPWWPDCEPDPASLLLGTLLGHRVDGGARADTRPSHFADAGLSVLRSGPDDEIWCRTDGGPHGFLSIAAHAHADALSVEVRHRGVDVLADPGTYCYQGAPEWRSYFRSTIAHNTVEVDGRDQSDSEGPFLWVRHARSEIEEAPVALASRQRWSATHDGYLGLPAPLRHRRTVELDVEGASLEITDTLESAAPHALRIAFHLGPSIDAVLSGARAELCWQDAAGERVQATLELPDAFEWSSYRGSTEPILGWYSPGFGRKVPATTLIGCADVAGGTFTTVLRIPG